ncbi:MAG: hypothetical protein GMKNLPBB_01695 [Myxococcota bacterium]|nr:hypothetical protein [Myxococcota bacterium]
MPVIFPPWTNKLPLATAAFAAIAPVGAIVFFWYWGSPAFTDVGYQPIQPVPFSHQLHAGQLGMDCRYCHNAVERSPYAAVPPSETCMNCHKLVLKDSVKLAKVRESHETGKAVEWVRVHMLPDYAYFDHSVHLAAGVGCASCHGRVDQMKLVKQEKPLSMGWCLECHRAPEKHLRPKSEITNMEYDPVKAGYKPDEDPDRVRKVSQLAPPIHCSGCHR